MTLTRTTLLLAALAAALPFASGATCAQVYKVTDSKNGVVFTDNPGTIDSTDVRTIEELDVPATNIAAPVDATPQTSSQSTMIGDDSDEDDEVAPSVEISSPANETTIAMGPGNFSVSAQSTPPLSGGELLVLMVDGQAYGAPQRSASWFLEGVLRGPHDLVVQRTTRGGRNIATSEPVRVYVLRPSIIGR